MSTLPSQCPRCNSTNIVIADGTGPHAGALRCGECDRWLKWLSRSEVERLSSQLNRSNPPPG